MKETSHAHNDLVYTSTAPIIPKPTKFTSFSLVTPKRMYKHSIDQSKPGDSLDPEIKLSADNKRLCSITKKHKFIGKNPYGKCSLERANLYNNKYPLMTMKGNTQTNGTMNKTFRFSGDMNGTDKVVERNLGQCELSEKIINKQTDVVKRYNRNKGENVEMKYTKVYVASEERKINNEVGEIQSQNYRQPENNNNKNNNNEISNNEINRAEIKRTEIKNNEINNNEIKRTDVNRLVCDSYKSRFFVGKIPGKEGLNAPSNNDRAQSSHCVPCDSRKIYEPRQYKKVHCTDMEHVVQSDSAINDMHSYKNSCDSRIGSIRLINKEEPSTFQKNIIRRENQKIEHNSILQTKSMKNNKKINPSAKIHTEDSTSCAEETQSYQITKGPWSKEEDRELVRLIKKYGPKNWSKIADNIGTRIGKQCRERWHNHLHPNIKKTPFTTEEDKIIIRLHDKFGNRWSEISKFLPGRTDNAIKNHWNSALQKRMKKRSYSAESMVCIKKFDDRCCCMDCSDEKERLLMKRSMSVAEPRCYPDYEAQNGCNGGDAQMNKNLGNSEMNQIRRNHNTHYGRQIVGPYKILSDKPRNERDRKENIHMFQDIKMSEKYSVVKEFEKMSDDEKTASIALLKLFNCM